MVQKALFTRRQTEKRPAASKTMQQGATIQNDLSVVSSIQTILSAPESHRVSTLAGGRGLYRRWGISPRPETNFRTTSIADLRQNARGKMERPPPIASGAVLWYNGAYLHHPKRSNAMLFAIQDLQFTLGSLLLEGYPAFGARCACAGLLLAAGLLLRRWLQKWLFPHLARLPLPSHAVGILVGSFARPAAWFAALTGLYLALASLPWAAAAARPFLLKLYRVAVILLLSWRSEERRVGNAGCAGFVGKLGDITQAFRHYT